MPDLPQVLHRNTPTVTVVDNRGLAVRTIAYCRRPDELQVTDERLTHHQHDARGVLARSADPRLAATDRANFIYRSDLAGTALHTRSIDAGASIILNDAAGRPFMAVSQVATDEDGHDDLRQAVTRTWQYEAPALAGRPLSVTEQVGDSEARVTERFVWADTTAQAQAHNLVGQAVSHYDPAGLVKTTSITLTGVPSAVTRQLLKHADNPDIAADWQGEGASDWDTRLALETYTTQSTADATGTQVTTLDAAGHLQRVAFDVAGQLSGSWLTIKGKAEQTIVKAVSYAATGQKLREEHGNGVVTTYTYEPMTQRLASIKTERPTGHASGAKVLQDLRYAYDPVGNVLKIRNDAEATRFWRNQKVVPENTYTYDSLYQLISATGREMANAGQQGRHLPHVTPFDSATYTPYTRTYRYDTAGNLIQIRHSAPATNNGYTTDITVSERSNRAVLSTLAKEPSAVEALFTPGGQQAVLLPGQSLAWTPRAELEQVVSVKREGSPDDRESYRYDSSSQRVLKASSQQTAGSTQAQRVIYLPGLELRIHANGDTLIQDLQVATVGEAGRAQVRVLHWEAGKPADIPNDQVRYSYDNLLGSSALEVDSVGNLISQEEYYPFGGTAVWAARNEVEARYKTVRYSGKERDATGLYYYGYRYYQPWIGRWLAADPAGTVDGLNLFYMVRNNPMRFGDDQGKFSIELNRKAFMVAAALAGIAYLATRRFSRESSEAVKGFTGGGYFSRKPPFLKSIPSDTKDYGDFSITRFNDCPPAEKSLLIQAHGRLQSPVHKIYDVSQELNFYTKLNRVLQVSSADVFKFQTRRIELPVVEVIKEGHTRDYELQHIGTFNEKDSGLLFHSALFNRGIRGGVNASNGLPLMDVLTVHPSKRVRLSKILDQLPRYKEVNCFFCRARVA
ncbi:RHS repeat protein [Pseudomonas monteilii]|nr:RHS repeat protein [Pseudomonas monteilii]